LSRNNLLIIFLSFLCCTTINASHIVGGELNYRCLGSNQYEIILTIYRDCFFGNPSVWFDNPASIGFFNSNNQRVASVGNNGQILVRLMNNDTLSPVLENECLVIPPSVCVHTTTYRDTVELPFLEGGYQLVYQRCCRNETIQNIVDPSNTGASFYAFISELALMECNTGAIFKEWPPVYICANEPIVFDHSAEDAEGDSLVYRLCTPISGATPSNPRPQPPFNPPYDPIVWASPFDLDNVLGGDPLRIDAETGMLTGTPALLGQFVVGICADEFRDGKLISTTRRDFQYNVGVCGVPTATFLAADTICGNRLALQNMSRFTDDVQWIINGPGVDSLKITTFNLDIQLPGPGIYEVTLIANPGTQCSDTAVAHIILSGSFLNVDFEIDQTSCSDSLDITLRSQSIDSLYQIIEELWSISIGDSVMVLSGRIIELTIPAIDSVEICHLATNEFGCKDSVCLWFYPDFITIGAYEDTICICPGDTATIDLGEFDSSYIITWSPEDLIIGNINASSVQVLTNKDTTIQFTITKGLCVLTGEIALKLLDSIENLQITAVPSSLKPGETTQLTIDFNENYTYKWSPEGRLDNSDIHNPVARPLITTIYTVYVENEDGCNAIFEIEVEVLSFICSEEFVFIPNAFSPDKNGINDTWNVRSNVLDRFNLFVYDRWGNKVFETQDIESDWDGTIKGKPANKDVYAYYFEGYCTGGELIILKGDLTVF
jgi:gliding motility-associated-like protein